MNIASGRTRNSVKIWSTLDTGIIPVEWQYVCLYEALEASSHLFLSAFGVKLACMEADAGHEGVQASLVG